MDREEPAAGADLRAYAPRLLLEWLHEAPDEVFRLVDGSVVLADISGFTRLSERLASRGRVGAEELTDAIARCFDALLAVAYDKGASLLKFGGDATLLLFTGQDHALRACISAAAMRQALRDLGPLSTSRGSVRLRISTGVHTGELPFFLVGDSHRELVLAGEAFSEVVDMEATADAGEVVVSAATAAALPARGVGRAKGRGYLLAGGPGRRTTTPLVQPLEHLSTAVVAASLSTAVRRHVLAGVDEPEHRRATVAFLHYDGTDARIRDAGPAAVARELDALLREVQRCADKHGVCLLGTDVDHNGGKVLLVAGAPTSTGEDEQSLLLAMREVLDAGLPLPLRIGVHAGPVFAGAVGPRYRRTYTVMGDAVNLAARVMAKARPGQLLATDAVLSRSLVRFATQPLEPFPVKGKTALVQAHEVGPPVWGAVQARSEPRLVGRDEELGSLRELLLRAQQGQGALVELVGEAGMGKTRLLRELIGGAYGVRVLTASCAAYESLTPYFAFRALLRQLLELPEGSTARSSGDRLRDVVAERCPDLLPWLPLLAIPLAAEVAPTPEVEALDEAFVRAKVHDVVTALLGVLLDGPTIVAVDDVHWSDEASAELLHRVVRDVALGPWLVCVARRESSTGFLAPEGPHVATLRPGPLSFAAAQELADDLADADPLAHRLSPHDLAALAAQSGGNPLFLLELVTSAAAAGGVHELPGSVEALIMARIDRLDPPDRALLRRLAVFGQAADHALVAAALGAEAPPLTSPTWDRLAEFVSVQGTRLRFEHGLVRDGAYSSTPFRLRKALHARIAAALEDDPESDGVASVLSLHWFQAERYDEAWRYSRAAAAQAQAAYANAEAVDLYERALVSARHCVVDAAELAAVCEEAADLYSRLGKYAESDRLYRRALDRTAATASQVRLVRKRGELRQRFGQYPAAVRWLRDVVRRAGDVPGPEGRSLLAGAYAALASVAKDQGRHAHAVVWCRRAIEVAREVDDRRTLAHAYSLHDGSCTILGRLGEARFGQDALALAEELGDLRTQGIAHSNLGLLAVIQGRWDEGLEHWDRSRDALRALGDELNGAVVSANLAEARLDQGRLDEAERFARQAARVWSAAGDRASSAYAARLLARIEAQRGVHEAALERLERAGLDFVAVGAAEEAAETTARKAEVLVLAARAEEAAALCADLLGREAAAHLDPLLQRVLGFACAQLGDTARARAAFERSLTAAEEAGADVEAAQALRALVRLGGEGAQERSAQLSVLLERLGLVALLDPPLGAPTSPAPLLVDGGDPVGELV